MKGLSRLILGILVVAGGFALYTSIFTVHQTRQALVLEFGNPKRVVTDAGLHFKLPWQSVQYYERRVLNLDPPVQRVLLLDQSPLLVDAYARYRIINPLLFFQRVRTEGTAGNRLDTVVNATLRGVLGNATLASVLSEERAEIMLNIRDQVNVEAGRLGIEVVDVRTRRADLPDETSQAVYARMKSEREREAAEFRAQGSERAQFIRASADREATVIRAEAKRETQILRGEGEAERTRLLNDAFGRDRSFFEFYRSMSAYEVAIDEENSLLVIPPDNEFFRFFNESGAME